MRIVPRNGQRTWLAAISLALALNPCMSGCALMGFNKTSEKPIPAGAAKAAGDSSSSSGPTSMISEFMGGVSGRVTGKLPAYPETAKKLYQEADVKFREAGALADANQRKKRFEEAAAGYTAAAGKWPDSSLEEDALFAAGDSMIFAENYPDANQAFERLLKKYPNTRHLDNVEARRFRVAQWWLDESTHNPDAWYSYNFFDESRPGRDTQGHAVRIFDRIRREDPTGRLADDATLAAANAFFAQGKLEKADVFYDDLRSNFPSSEHQFSAHFLGLKTKLASYRGPDYDGTTLKEAEKLILKMKRQFPQDFEREKEFLVRALAEIRYKLALREWDLARYYDNRGEYGAARYYYNRVTRDYSDTPLAYEANERIEKIADKPAVPENRFQWIVDLFPEPEETKSITAVKPLNTQMR